MIPDLFSIPNLLTLMLVVTRVSGMMLTAPIFSNAGVPAPVKIWFSVLVGFLMLPTQLSHAASLPADLFAYGLLMAQELIVGLLLGFVVAVFFTGIQMAGEQISMQMGLASASVLDPLSRAQVPAFSQFYFYFALMLFLSFNIHHSLIVALYKSFRWVPVGHALPNAGLLSERMMAVGSDLFLLGVMLALPIVGILLLSEIAMGFVAKVMPQMNIFMVGMPIKVAIGLFAIMVSLPLTASFLSERYSDLVQTLLRLMAT